MTVDDLARPSTSRLFPQMSIPSLFRYELPRQYAEDLLDRCEGYGFSGATLFPGLDGACRQALEKRARIESQEFSERIWSAMLGSPRASDDDDQLP
jgi:hypothetical protein